MQKTLLARIDDHMKLANSESMGEGFRHYHFTRAEDLKIQVRRLPFRRKPETNSKLLIDAKEEARRFLAQKDCKVCNGLGLTIEHKLMVCNCVYRRIFRICYVKRQLSDFAENYRIRLYNRKNGLSAECPLLEYNSDMYILARKLLGPVDWIIYLLHFDAGLTWQQALPEIPKLYRFLYNNQAPPAVDKGLFFHRTYAIQSQLGEAFLENDLWPYERYCSKPVRSRIRRAYGVQSMDAMYAVLNPPTERKKRSILTRPEDTIMGKRKLKVKK